MGKKQGRTISNYYFLSLNLVVLLTAIISFALAIQSGISRLEHQMEILSDRLYEEQKNELISQVDSAIQLIELERNNVQMQREEELIDYVKNGRNIIENYYYSNVNEKSFHEIREEVIELLRPFRFFNDEGYYFMFTPQGTELLYPIRPDLEGVNNLDWQDSDGVYFIREMIDLVREHNEGAISYRIEKPGTIGDSFLKHSYISYISELDVIIGAGYYLSSIQQQAQEKAAISLDIFGATREKQYFGASYDGTVVIGSNRGINRITNPIGDSVKIITDLVAISKNGGGFYEYIMPPLDENSRETRKLSYVLPYDDWDWYVGTGAYVEDFDLFLAGQRESLRRELLRNLAILLPLLLFIYGLLFILLRIVSKPIRQSTEYFISALEKAVEEDTPIEVSDILFKEFQTLAHAANDILLKKQESQQALFQKQKMEALGRLAGGVAHDINNQLTGVMGYADLLSASKLSKEDHEYLEQMMEGAYRASDLVRELLRFSRNDTVKRTSVDIHQVLNKVGQFVERTVDKSIHFRLELNADNSKILGDENKIYSLFLNLVINSVDALPKGGIIIINTENEDENINILLRDNGSGIEKEDLDKVFELFFTTKPQGKGTGLGLSIVYETVKEFKGAISIDSEPGKGTVVSLSFPFLLDDLED